MSRNQENEDAFACLHPAVELLFFLGAMGVGIFLVHPLSTALSVGAAALYYMLLTGGRGSKTLLPLLAVGLALAVLNPLLVPVGDTVLFTYLRGRPFTLEALCYGGTVGGMFIAVLLWFACYNRIMTSDKFVCLFGRLIPALSLLLSMILRLVPAFQGKARSIVGARMCVGKAPADGERRQQLQHSADILSVLTSWALEGAVVTADSMRSRGYGAATRSSFTIYRRASRDWALGAVLCAALSLLLVSAVLGGAHCEFYPGIQISFNTYSALGAVGYGCFLLTPSVLHIWEDVTWHVLRSKI